MKGPRLRAGMRLWVGFEDKVESFEVGSEFVEVGFSDSVY